ncbi:HD domain-containing protein [Cerasibacillus terrae]|uniref:HD domain-containing protein n=1 Tax=Cerasibacillus terrae TaxID=2498845 RepID=A0A5C8P2Y2_9BACI|nr:HD domain-containing protein [Cerasibacillus terrae]TXL67818.1 HD domain-containing protein [Cerasibacillus terrae]
MYDQGKQLEAVENYVYNLFHKDSTGHDYYHLLRVMKMAKIMAQQEGADLFICQAAAWLHDVGDIKLFSNPKLALDRMEEFLLSIHIKDEDIKKIKLAIQDVSYSKGKQPKTIEGKIVQDADRLDAIGAIGIARTFAYGGAKGQGIYHPAQPKETSIQHFYDKLLHLKSSLHTKSARHIAEERHQFMEVFLDQFFKEWNM